ncbi:GAF domain-containing protein [Parvularcula oceani]|uniref:GAF domain-containing protein n=1 Tax=Parvularcula oceani TaxID=1247963 RepID=UPI00068C1870|nr:GAF domain-containing protein [Parvularcula oceani]
MSASPRPALAEAARLAALRRYEVLDTSPEPAFDRLTRLVSALLGAPICLISLVDEERQWFKSKVGLSVTQTARDLAFCEHAIRSDSVLVVPDATLDARFAHNPLVTGAPEIRTYAGAPLMTADGHALGTICVIWDSVTPVTGAMQAQLRDAGGAVMDALELRRTARLASEGAAARARFLAAINHDVRTPLNGILGMFEILRSSSSEDARTYAQVGYGCASDLCDLLTKALEAAEDGSPLQLYGRGPAEAAPTPPPDTPEAFRRAPPDARQSMYQNRPLAAFS